MSVLIKGMEMPGSCADCQLKYQLYETGIWFCNCLATDSSDTDVSYKGKPFDFVPEWCPLVEIPTPHGRLIDGDELKTAFPRMDNPTDIKIHSVRATINHMPTVIEAEE